MGFAEALPISQLGPHALMMQRMAWTQDRSGNAHLQGASHVHEAGALRPPRARATLKVLLIVHHPLSQLKHLGARLAAFPAVLKLPATGSPLSASGAGADVQNQAPAFRALEASPWLIVQEHA